MVVSILSHGVRTGMIKGSSTSETSKYPIMGYSWWVNAGYPNPFHPVNRIWVKPHSGHFLRSAEVGFVGYSYYSGAPAGGKKVSDYVQVSPSQASPDNDHERKSWLTLIRSFPPWERPENLGMLKGWRQFVPKLCFEHFFGGAGEQFNMPTSKNM